MFLRGMEAMTTKSSRCRHGSFKPCSEHRRFGSGSFSVERRMVGAEMLRQGATTKEVAARLDVNQTTAWVWKALVQRGEL